MSARPFTTDKQRQAARRNGAKSRGPATDEGKRKASANNQRHLLATDSIEHVVHDPAFHEILAGYRRDFAPANAIEDELVIHMAAARWRSILSSSLECATLDEYARIAAEEAGPDTAHTRMQIVTLGFKRALREGVPLAAYHPLRGPQHPAVAAGLRLADEHQAILRRRENTVRTRPRLNPSEISVLTTRSS